MIRRLAGSLLLTTVLAAGAQASSVTIDAPTSVLFGETFEINLIGDFEDGLLAGGLQLTYDPSLISITGFSTNLNVDTDLSCPGAALCPVDPAGVFSIVWGQFLADLAPVGTTGLMMATLTATAFSPPSPAEGGAATLDLQMQDFSAFTGGWFGAGFTTIATPDLIGAQVQIVPLPAAVWFMIGGLGVLARFRRK